MRSALVDRDLVHAVDDNLALQFRGEPGKQVAVAVVGHRDDDDIGLACRISVRRTGDVAVRCHLGRNRGGARCVTGADHDAVPRPRKAPAQPAALVSGAAKNRHHRACGSVRGLVVTLRHEADPCSPAPKPIIREETGRLWRKEQREAPPPPPRRRRDRRGAVA